MHLDRVPTVNVEMLIRRPAPPQRCSPPLSSPRC
jgi:hypothetical protein